MKISPESLSSRIENEYATPRSYTANKIQDDPNPYINISISCKTLNEHKEKPVPLLKPLKLVHLTPKQDDNDQIVFPQQYPDLPSSTNA